MITQSIKRIDQDIYSRRVLRLSLGVALSMFFSQIVDWPLSFISPIFTALFLSLPIPAPSVKGSLVFIALLLGSVLCSFDLLPFIYYAPIAGILLVALGLFYSFYITSSGGPVIVGTFLTLSLTLVTTIGSVSIDMLYETTKALASGSFFGFVFVWIAHILLPDIHTPTKNISAPKDHPAKPDRTMAAKTAFRSLLIVYPIMVLFLCLDTSTSYTVIMIKIATMGQQASGKQSEDMGMMLIWSTVWGGLGAIVAWIVLSACPILPMYILLTVLACLFYGRGIFKGAGLHPKSAMWSYSLITCIVVLAPAVGSMAAGDSSSDRFWTRLLYFLIIAFYGWFMVSAFEAFSSKKRHLKPLKNSASITP